MTARRLRLPVSLFAIASLLFAACGGQGGGGQGGGGASPGATGGGQAGGKQRVEVFSWWTTGGEAAGLEKLIQKFNSEHPQWEVFNAAVAGGAGSNAKAVLKTRMLGGDPPDSFQVHMGKELIDTWVATNPPYMEPLDDLYRSEGWTDKFPKGVLDIVSHDGHYWSVPVNIHRANVLWYNKKLFSDAGVSPPRTFEDFKKAADALKAKGITPLALGDKEDWAAVHLFETVLLGVLGSDGYKGLWTGETDWNGQEVKEALEQFKTMLQYVNPDHDALTWDGANDLVIQGKAAMTIMGDWVDGDYVAKKFQGYGWAPTPETEGVYQALSDTFGLPKNAKHPEATKEFLKLLGSAEGQDIFNPVKGSIPARIDGGKPPAGSPSYDAYLQSAMEDWKRDEIVPSLAHGAAASESWVTEITDAIGAFVTNQDVAATQSALANACKTATVCK